MEQGKSQEVNTLSEQLALLENSQGLIRTILLGIALQYRALEQQKLLLISDVPVPFGPDVKAIQLAASLIVLCALFGFQKQDEALAAETTAAGGCPDFTEPRLNAIMIAIALVRLCRLVEPTLQEVPEDLSLQAEPAF